MPATAVHAFFAKDVFDILPITVKENIKEDKITSFTIFYPSNLAKILETFQIIFMIINLKNFLLMY